MKHLINQTIISFALLGAHALAKPIEGSNSSINSHTQELAIYYSLKGDIEKPYNTLVEKKLKSIGFNLTDPHKRVNDQYAAKYGSTVLDILSFMPVVRDSSILPLLNIDPRIAGFAPFNVVIHKKLDENVTHVGHLMPSVMLDILGIQNQEVRKKFSAPFKALDATIAHELGGHIATIPYKKLPEKTMINYEYTFQTPEDMDDFIDKFQNKFELAFINKGYLIAGFHNFMESTDNAEVILSNYDAFWTYSLCHLKFSYHMFDNENGRPEAALFAPCTMYMYIRKGTNTLVIGMFRLQNWADTLNITDETRLKLIKQLDTEIPEILETFGMKSVANINPLLANASKEIKVNEIEKPADGEEKNSLKGKTQSINVGGDSVVKITLPAVPTPIKVASNSDTGLHRSITFSKRVPPNYVAHRFDKNLKDKKSTNTRIGAVNKGKISAYLRGGFMEPAKIKEKLETAGFDVVATVPVNKQEDLISIIFTDKVLMDMANKKNRGFMASLRVLVDTKEKRISITNPLYMAKGFLQNDFDEKDANKVLQRILTQFTDLKNSKDMLKYQLLPKYQFMNGMPHYQDIAEVATGENLLEKIKDNNRVVFSQKLQNGATLIGIRLSKKTRTFTQRIGRNNAAMLPYPILIENGKAKILDPKYYISFMYPLLTMSEFMTIAMVPDAMIKDCEKVFK